MEIGGYPHERVARLESLHYWAYVGVYCIFIIDLLAKLLTFLFLRRVK